MATSKRRNPGLQGYEADGKFHPIRNSPGYSPEKGGDKKAAPKRRYRKPRLKAGSPEGRKAKAAGVLEGRRRLRAVQARASVPKRRPKAGTPEERTARAKSLLAQRAKQRRQRELARERDVVLRSDDSLSSGQWRRAGEPNWWARVGQGDSAHFLRFHEGPQPARYRLHATVTVPSGTTRVFIGAGKDRNSIRETVEI